MGASNLVPNVATNPTMAQGVAQAQAQAQQQANQAAQQQPTQLGAPTATVAHHQQQMNGPGNPYSGYNLANVDMSSFQNVDWSSLYGMGMYV